MSGFRCRQHGLWRNVLRVLPLLTLASTTLTLTGPEARAQNTPGIAAESDAGVSTTLPFVSPIFGDNMVMQRGKINTIWGWSQSGDTIRVVIGDHSVAANTAKDGRWEARILPPETPGPW